MIRQIYVTITNRPMKIELPLIGTLSIVVVKIYDRSKNILYNHVVVWYLKFAAPNSDWKPKLSDYSIPLWLTPWNYINDSWSCDSRDDWQRGESAGETLVEMLLFSTHRINLVIRYTIHGQVRYFPHIYTFIEQLKNQLVGVCVWRSIYKSMEGIAVYILG